MRTWFEFNDTSWETPDVVNQSSVCGAAELNSKISVSTAKLHDDVIWGEFNRFVLLCVDKRRWDEWWHGHLQTTKYCVQKWSSWFVGKSFNIHNQILSQIKIDKNQLLNQK